MDRNPHNNLCLKSIRYCVNIKRHDTHLSLFGIICLDMPHVMPKDNYFDVYLTTIILKCYLESFSMADSIAFIPPATLKVCHYISTATQSHCGGNIKNIQNEQHLIGSVEKFVWAPAPFQSPTIGCSRMCLQVGGEIQRRKQIHWFQYIRTSDVYKVCIWCLVVILWSCLRPWGQKWRPLQSLLRPSAGCTFSNWSWMP